MSAVGAAHKVPPGEYKTQGHGERIAESGLAFRVLEAGGVHVRCYCIDFAKCGCVDRILTTYRLERAP